MLSLVNLISRLMRSNFIVLFTKAYILKEPVIVIIQLMLSHYIGLSQSDRIKWLYEMINEFKKLSNFLSAVSENVRVNGCGNASKI
jgi:hypothetical protein